MKQCNLTKGLVVFLTIMITLFCGLMPGAWADDVSDCDCCSNPQKIVGCYGFSHDGMMMVVVDGKPSKLPTPMASVGVLHLDGVNLTGHEMVQFGTDTFPAMLSGTYTLNPENPDCTGTASICATPTIPEGNNMGIWSEISFVINGDEIQMVTTKMTHCVSNVNTGVDAAIPLNIVGTAKKQCAP
ncbi:MAG: hypothetical protein JRD93_18400 [Deltaproteobacteria bacterium]|nr:hypothetical protein [Deltaproteobacteria bacterium]